MTFNNIKETTAELRRLRVLLDDQIHAKIGVIALENGIDRLEFAFRMLAFKDREAVPMPDEIDDLMSVYQAEINRNGFCGLWTKQKGWKH
mgnify:CR=1 FL=1|tara:strand:+ start:1605 stop:1874 length:270 start_codon:yes stop_codon:yes gene_type:complete